MTQLCRFFGFKRDIDEKLLEFLFKGAADLKKKTPFLELGFSETIKSLGRLIRKIFSSVFEGI